MRKSSYLLTAAGYVAARGADKVRGTMSRKSGLAYLYSVSHTSTPLRMVTLPRHPLCDWIDGPAALCASSSRRLALSSGFSVHPQTAPATNHFRVLELDEELEDQGGREGSV